MLQGKCQQPLAGNAIDTTPNISAGILLIGNRHLSSNERAISLRRMLTIPPVPSAVSPSPWTTKASPSAPLERQWV